MANQSTKITTLVPSQSTTSLKIVNCIATPTAALVYFSDQPDSNAVIQGNNYQVFSHPGPSQDPVTVTIKTGDYDNKANTVILQLTPKTPLKVGDSLSVRASGLMGGTNTSSTDIFMVHVNGAESPAEANARRSTQAFEDSVAYPVMTEDVGNPPSSSYGGAGSGGGTGSGSLQLSQIATQTITNILGWKPKDDDAKGFVGALTQSFCRKDVEGHVEATWTPRTYAVQTDLSGGITGAQASLYLRAKEAMDQSLPLLDGLYALNPDSDPEMVTALKGLVRSQITELTGEMGFPGGPRISRANEYFRLLLGVKLPIKASIPSPHVASDPDQIGGNLARLRKELQLQSFSKYVNSIEDEQNITNYRILSDYLTSLAQSWVNNLQFFGLNTQHAFLGSQLVLLSRQLSVVADTVDEVRFTLDSVFIGAAERQTLQLEFAKDPAMFVEDLLAWTQTFAKDEGPQLIQNSGKLGVGDGFLPIIKKLNKLVGEARNPLQQTKLPQGFKTIRVTNSLRDLQDQIGELERLAQGVSSKEAPAEFDDQTVKTITQNVINQLRNRNANKAKVQQSSEDVA
jgi:hypothetical protein